MSEQGLLAERLAQLFETARKVDGSRYTQTEVVEGTHGVLTRVYLWKLRTGRATNPSFQIIKALADFFQVDANYFTQGDADEIGKPVIRPAGRYTQAIQERACQLDDKAQKAILDLMDYLLSIKTREQIGEINK